MTEGQKNLPPSEDPSSDDSAAIEQQSKRQEKTIARNVEWFINDFLPWSLGGLGGAGVIGFIIHSQVFNAIVTFVVTVIVASWAKYNRNFTRTLSTIAGKQADQDALSLAGWLGNGRKSFVEMLGWYCSGFTRQYLRDQAVDCRDLDTEGLNPVDLRIPMLTEVFVPLKLSGPREQRLSVDGLTKREVKRLQDEEKGSLDIWGLLRRSKQEPYYRQIAIRARGGYGKTTLLQHIALIYGTGQYWKPKFRSPKRVPFLIRLRNYREELNARTIEPLPKLIHRHHLRDLAERGITPPTPHWAEILLRRGDALVMLDGFDEVPASLRPKVSQWITKQMQTYDQATFILTSRPVAYEDNYVAKRPSTPILVRPFTVEQQRDFVNNWYVCQERAYRNSDGDRRKVVNLKAGKKAKEFLKQLGDRPELAELSKIPLLLNLLVTYHRNSVSPELPRQRLELYRGICKLQLSDRPIARGIPMRVSYDRAMGVLQALAWDMSNREQPIFTISRSAILDFLGKQPILKKEKVTPETFLKTVVEVAELLVEKDAGEYDFPHLSFQGFFAANALMSVLDNQKIALDKWLQAKDSPLWQEILPFFTAQLPAEEFEEIIRLSLKLGSDAVQTSEKCLNEYRTQDEQLQKEIEALGGALKISRYTKLRQLLKAGQWAEADRETWRVMLEVKDKDAGDYLSADDLKTFPCDDLLAIDRLWVDASKGHFGFSVQKKIWEDCGSLQSTGKNWDRFCDRVGWKEESKYVSYSALKKDPLHSPAGELPSRTLPSGVAIEGRPVISRASTCEL
jgi:GUN4-like/NACHT domain